MVQAHDDVFADPRTRDDVWLPEVAAKGWIVLSHDKRQRRVRVERDAAMNAGATVFYLIGKHHDEVTRNLIATIPKIIRFREKNKPPFLARVTRPDPKFPVGSRPGNVDMALTKDEWLKRRAQGR